jgi:hypothetical protein
MVGQAIRRPAAGVRANEVIANPVTWLQPCDHCLPRGHTAPKTIRLIRQAYGLKDFQVKGGPGWRWAKREHG